MIVSLGFPHSMARTLDVSTCIVKRFFHWPFRDADSPLYTGRDRPLPLGFRDALWAKPGQRPGERRR